MSLKTIIESIKDNKNQDENSDIMIDIRSHLESNNVMQQQVIDLLSKVNDNLLGLINIENIKFKKDQQKKGDRREDKLENKRKTSVGKGLKGAGITTAALVNAAGDGSLFDKLATGLTPLLLKAITGSLTGIAGLLSAKKIAQIFKNKTTKVTEYENKRFKNKTETDVDKAKTEADKNKNTPKDDGKKPKTGPGSRGRPNRPRITPVTPTIVDTPSGPSGRNRPIRAGSRVKPDITRIDPSKINVPTGTKVTVPPANLNQVPTGTKVTVPPANLNQAPVVMDTAPKAPSNPAVDVKPTTPDIEKPITKPKTAAKMGLGAANLAGAAVSSGAGMVNSYQRAADEGRIATNAEIFAGSLGGTVGAAGGLIDLAITGGSKLLGSDFRSNVGGYLEKNTTNSLASFAHLLGIGKGTQFASNYGMGIEAFGEKVVNPVGEIFDGTASKNLGERFTNMIAGQGFKTNTQQYEENRERAREDEMTLLKEMGLERAMNNKEIFRHINLEAIANMQGFKPNPKMQSVQLEQASKGVQTGFERSSNTFVIQSPLQQQSKEDTIFIPEKSPNAKNKDDMGLFERPSF